MSSMSDLEIQLREQPNFVPEGFDVDDLSTYPTFILLRLIARWQGVQKTTPHDSRDWTRASEALQPLFAEVARRQRAGADVDAEDVENFVAELADKAMRRGSRERIAVAVDAGRAQLQRVRYDRAGRSTIETLTSWTAVTQLRPSLGMVLFHVRAWDAYTNEGNAEHAAAALAKARGAFA